MKRYAQNLMMGLFILLNIQCNVSNHKINSSGSLLLIKELIVQPNTIVKVKGDKLKVYERDYDSNPRGIVKTKYTVKLEADELNILQGYASKLLDLNESYSRGMIGGILWEIKINLGSESKTIIFSNTLHETAVELFEYLNELVPGEYLFAVSGVPLYEE